MNCSSLCRRYKKGYYVFQNGEEIFSQYNRNYAGNECFISYHRKGFTENKITFHGLRHTYAHEKYDEFILKGMTDFQARKSVSELLGHHREDVTRIYLAGDEKPLKIPEISPSIMDI